MKNLLTDIPGVRVGHADDAALASGVTAVLFDAPVVASIDVRGGGPGTREGSLLDVANTVERIDGIALSGGSAFGLDAGGGVQAWLAEQGRGLQVRGAIIPIVPGAICFDLLNGGDKKWGRFAPYRDLGYTAAAAAAVNFALGSVGAGLGATTANFKGGIGSASAMTQGGVKVAALAVVNAVGSVTVGDGPWFWAAPFETGGEYGGRGWPASFTPDMLAMRLKGGPAATARRKYHARGGRDRCGTDQVAGQAAGRDRADRICPRDLSGACAARWRCGVRRRDRRKADRSAGRPHRTRHGRGQCRRPRHRARHLHGVSAALPGRAAGLEGPVRLATKFQGMGYLRDRNQANAMPSTAIRNLFYVPAKRELWVTFVTGRRYVYADVPSDVFDAFKVAPSRGAFFNQEIRDRYRFREVERKQSAWTEDKKLRR